jgi:ribosomal protein L37AE/L43A
MVSLTLQRVSRDNDVLGPNNRPGTFLCRVKALSMRIPRTSLCPRCRATLSHTGGFWECAQCALTITHQALRVESATCGGAANGVDREGRISLKAAG